MIAHFADRLSPKDVEILNDLAVNKEGVVAFENLCSIIASNWGWLTRDDVARMRAFGADWERISHPVDWNKFESRARA